MKYHELKLTAAEYGELPKGPFPDGYLEKVEFGFRFVTGKDPNIIGEVVEGMDMFQDQWAGLSVPKRGCRWYKVNIVEEHEDAA